jgi:hypothetical protein
LLTPAPMRFPAPAASTTAIRFGWLFTLQT